jgi:hypothetical protein
MSIRSFSGCSPSAGLDIVCKTESYFVAGVQVDAAAEAMIQTPVFEVVSRDGDGQTGGGQRVSGGMRTERGLEGTTQGGRGTERGCCTHPFDAIVGIGAAGARVQSRGARGSGAA